MKTTIDIADDLLAKAKRQARRENKTLRRADSTWHEQAEEVIAGLAEGWASCWETLDEILHKSRVLGGAVHDARIAALCLRHGVKKLLSADRDYGRFPGLKTANPLLHSEPR